MNKAIKIGGIVLGIAAVGYASYHFFLKDYLATNAKKKKPGDLRATNDIQAALMKPKYNQPLNVQANKIATSEETSSFLGFGKSSWLKRKKSSSQRKTCNYGPGKTQDCCNSCSALWEGSKYDSCFRNCFRRDVPMA